MRTVHSLVTLLASAGLAAADYGIHIPQVDAAVQQMLSKFGSYVGYHGPSGQAAAQAENWHPEHAPSPATYNNGGYWLEQIKHQGVAAFNPNAGYQIFRNVMVPFPPLLTPLHSGGQAVNPRE